MAAGAQVMMSRHSFYRLGIGCSGLAYCKDVLTPQLDVHDGFYRVSDRVGLGHELNPEYVATGTVKSLID